MFLIFFSLLTRHLSFSRAVNQSGEATSSCSIKVCGSPRIDTSSLFPDTLSTLQQFEVVTMRRKGPDSTEADAPAEVIPYFTSHIQNVETVEGENILFECTVMPSNDPNLRVDILHNGKEITTGNRILTSYEFGYVRIAINCLRQEDAGIYNVKIMNEAGASMSSASLKVHTEPTIEQGTFHPQSTESIRKLETSTRQIVSKTTVTERFLYPPPNFVRPLMGQFNANEGDEMLLECQVVPFNDPTLKVEWSFNGDPLASSSRITHLESLGHIKLFVKDLMPKDSGVYRCRATSDSGEAFTTSQIIISQTSNIVEESIFSELREETLELPSITPLTGSNITVKEGSNLHIEARIEPVNDSSMTVEWYRNEQLLQVGHRVTTIHSFGYAILEVIDMSPKDMGKYRCIAKNSKGFSEHIFTVSLASLEESARPKFHYPFKSSLLIREGESVHVQTILSPKGDKNMKIEWFHNGQPLRQSSRYNLATDFGFVIFEISRAEPEDSGEYVVVATNNAGVDTNRFNLHCSPTASVLQESVHYQSMATIQQLERPKTYQAPSDEQEMPPMGPRFTCKLVEQVEVVEGQSVHLETQLFPVDDPTMQVEWLRNGAPLIASERFRCLNEFGFVILDITSFYEEDSGCYEIIARNQFGVDSIRTVITCRGEQ